MIAEPLNDRPCLEKLTDHARRQIANADLHAMARRFGSPAEVVLFLRAQPQRDDSGDPSDGPRIACDVTQRVRVPASDPNCVERALLYLVLAEILAPRATRQLVTIDTPIGRHTMPVEDGRPVVLDPRQTRNGCMAGMWRERTRNSGAARPFVRGDERHLLEWIADIAEEPAEEFAGELGLQAVRRARAAMRRLLVGWSVTAADADDIALALAAAERAAPLWGREGITNIRAARRAFDWLAVVPRRNLSWKDVGKAVRKAGASAGRTVLNAYGMGHIADDVLRPLEPRSKKPAPPPSAPPPPPPVSK